MYYAATGELARFAMFRPRLTNNVVPRVLIPGYSFERLNK
jgi:hypothetical protein